MFPKGGQNISAAEHKQDVRASNDSSQANMCDDTLMTMTSSIQENIDAKSRFRSRNQSLLIFPLFPSFPLCFIAIFS